jgi:hypothetical protein
LRGDRTSERRGIKQAAGQITPSFPRREQAFGGERLTGILQRPLE